MAKVKETIEVPANQALRKPTAKKAFDVADYKKKNNLDQGVKFKPIKWLPIRNILGNNSFCEATGIPGIPANEVVSIIGHTDSGKSLLSNQVAYSCQQEGVLPVFIITELKFSWEHLKMMGFEYEEVVDESTGEIMYEGDFLYLDRSQFDTIEGMCEKILKLLDDQEKGKLDRDLCFIIDSIGTIQCELSKKSLKANNKWDAGAISAYFGKSIIPKINLCKKNNYPYNNYMLIICQVWVKDPDSPMGKPRLSPKGGDTIPFNSTFQIVFGNVTNSGTSKLKVVKNSKNVTYATRTRVKIMKQHMSGISFESRLVATPHGFIEDSPNDEAAKKYFKNNSKLFMDILGGTLEDITFVKDSSEEEEIPMEKYKELFDTDSDE